MAKSKTGLTGAARLLKALFLQDVVLTGKVGSWCLQQRTKSSDNGRVVCDFEKGQKNTFKLKKDVEMNPESKIFTFITL